MLWENFKVIMWVFLFAEWGASFDPPLHFKDDEIRTSRHLYRRVRHHCRKCHGSIHIIQGTATHTSDAEIWATMFLNVLLSWMQHTFLEIIYFILGLFWHSLGKLVHTNTTSTNGGIQYIHYMRFKIVYFFTLYFKIFYVVYE